MADLSFISLRLVLPALVGCVQPEGDLVVLVKPQFEVGREQVGRGGVVRDPQARAGAIRGVAAVAGELGFGVRGLVQSSLAGPAGNLEYVLWLAASGLPLSEALLDVAMTGRKRMNREILVVAHPRRIAAHDRVQQVLNMLSAANVSPRVLADEAGALDLACSRGRQGR